MAFSSSRLELIVLLSIVNGVFCADSEYGYFWQITDIHYDANYSQNGLAKYLCHEQPPGQGQSNTTNTTTTSGEIHGKFGDPLCDSPWPLVSSAVQAMKELSPDVDFIIWTGDNVAHVPDNQLTESKLFQNIIQKVTDLLLEKFPDTPFYPTIGNHDSLPANQVPPVRQDPYYSYMTRYGHWKQMLQLDGESLKTFQKGGYYCTQNSHRLWVIGLNTMMWFQRNTLLKNLNITESGDPTGQFAWLRAQLKEIRGSGEKALLTGHAPPGTGYGRSASKPFYIAEYNRKLLRIIQEFSDVIVAMIFGHEHTDRWHLIYDEMGGAPIFPVFSAPAVSPVNGTAPGHNPALRLYKYSRSTGQVLDYTQYYLNLSAANAQQRANWLVEYTPTKAYGIPDVTAKALDGLLQDFKKPQSEKFQQFVLYMSVSNNPSQKCTGVCKQQAICGIQNLDLTLLEKCVANQTLLDIWLHNAQGKDHTERTVSHIVIYIVAAVIAVAIIIAIAGAALYYRKRRAMRIEPKTQYSLLLSDEDTELDV